jgi:hypothetical protein
MHTKTLARHYDRLSAEERFRLILAAGARGDKIEQQRLVSSGQRITLSVQDHAPYAQAFDELSRLIFIELLEEAAHYCELFACVGEVHDDLGDEEEDEESDVEEGKAATSAEEASDARADAESTRDDEGDLPLWQGYLDMALAAGFVLRTKADGWKLFCKRMTVPPFALWEGLPGFDRLQHALHLAEKAAFVPEGFLRWLNTIRPAEEPERVEVPLTVEEMAAATEEVFRQRVEWWGG